jgi:hypothetical protein
MQIYFLSAKVPLTKTFSRLPSGAIDKSAYPLVKNFTSHEEEVNTPEELHRAITGHAARGHSLLKGRLNRALSAESRAGSTNPLDPTRWSCFDLDNVKGITSVESFIETVLPAAFRDVDYVLQYSASAGIMPDEGLRAHVFFIHEKDFTPEAAKLFLTELNLKNETLNRQLELTAAGTALRFPLDRTVCQNDKLIYIAPPALGDGVEDRFGDGNRIQLVRKERRFVNFDWGTGDPPAAVEALVQNKVAALRKSLGLKPKSASLRQMKSGEMLIKNPDTAVVTGEKKARGFVYLNLNGGDSWGYYYSEDNPKFLRNFKGEPLVELATFLPTYWAQIAGTVKKERKGPRPFAFRHRPTDVVYNGVYDPDKDSITDIAATTRAALPDFFSQYDMDPPAIEDWRFEFEPSNDRLIDFDARFCNRFERSPYMRDPGEAGSVPPTIEKVIRHVLADDQQCYDHFMNWLAAIFQRRIKTGVAWVMHGVQGTGKGILFHKVLAPLFGPAYCVSKQIAGVEDRYNADMEQCLLFNLDEARVEDSAQARRTINKLKNAITEPIIEIRAMRANPYQARSFTNFIFTSNDYDALAIAPDDRRYSVAPRQEQKIQLTSDEVDKLLPKELAAFAGYLATYKCDLDLARTALMNDAKRAMRDASQDALEQMAQAVIDGNLGYFFMYLDTSTASVVNLVAWSNYKAVLKRWLDVANQDYVVRRSDLMDAYVYLMNPPTAPGPHKFGRMMAHKNVALSELHRCPATKEVLRGFKTKWLASEEEMEEWKRALESKASTAPPTNSNVAQLRTA